MGHKDEPATLSNEDILLTLVQGEDGSYWAKDHEGWKKDNPDGVCFWDGVDCDPETETEVEAIRLPAAGLIGTLPTELGLLTSLKELSLPKNVIHGSIPNKVAALPRLVELNLAENEITGTFPQFSSSKIRKIILSKNELTGTLPSALGVGHHLLALEEFDVAKNKFTGTVSDVFAPSKKLSLLSLSDNVFSGTIPDSINGGEVLEELYLNRNAFVGPIPLSIADSRTRLREVWLQNNMLSGTVPISISSMSLLKHYYVEGNKLTGTIPASICRADLNADFFEGVADTVTDRNYCDAFACPAGSTTLDGQYPCKACPNLNTNPYLGQQGRCTDLKTSDILKNLYETAGGQDWVDGISWDYPDYTEKNVNNIPIYCDFSGVECDVNGHVVALNLSNRNLKGWLPPTIGFLPYLERLDVSHNDLTGFLPSELRFTPLENLNVADNRLKGRVPPMFCLKGGVNGNGNKGEYDCDHLACPVGTYSHTGMGPNCRACSKGNGFTLGATDCSKGAPMVKGKEGHHRREGGMSGIDIFGLILLSMCVLWAVGFFVLRHMDRRRMTKGAHELPQHEWSID
eukprot:CAMPEP_0172500918 /NCGR_PEP_ID=MMETSP1066-20121228/144124_1 /TAXON_ID=671091 /ORGANISM="Coscinodiscus wailesii, Strain CCMP2513" /LENGTH=571 /DNA_ID=CAMNT_0013275417 /DNA_START=104 /DNA_END=1819 /DNA_ORIENTATION=+